MELWYEDNRQKRRMLKSDSLWKWEKELVFNKEGYTEYVLDDTLIVGTDMYYYRRNHLGSNVAVWNATKNETPQRMFYYASGLPMKVSIGQNIQRYKYNNKAFEELNGLNEYDNQARRYYPAICRTTTMDPLAEKYYSISPYAWCGNNPVRNIDPDGMDVWEIDSMGHIINYERNSDEDILNMANYDGKSIEFEYGRITEKENDNNTTTFSFNDNQDALKAFQFLADNSNVEYMLMTTSSNNAILTTQHNAHSVNPSNAVKEIMEKGDMINIMIHNHPSSSGPSGFKQDYESGDKFAAKAIRDYTQMPIEFSVYLPKTNQVVIYDSRRIIASLPMSIYMGNY